mgnify:CR=1 FL=1
MKKLISVIMPTYNRSDLVGVSIKSVLSQTYRDFELIVVDDGIEERAEKVVKSFNDDRIRYIQHEKSKGGGAARNTGIKNAKGEFVAFLDDDDEWAQNKLEIQVRQFEKTDDSIGFSFTAVENITDTGSFCTNVPDGVQDFHERALKRFSGFLTVTLMIKKQVFEEVGVFDEIFPSNQEPDLMIRVTKEYKGLGINKPLSFVNMKEHEHINSNWDNRINGRKMILEKYQDDFNKYPKYLAKHYFDLALMCRDVKYFKEAKKYFVKAIKINFKLLYIAHYFNVLVKSFLLFGDTKN